MEKGELIGLGTTAKIYKLGPDKVLKLFHDKSGEKRIVSEANISSAVHLAGVPSPSVFEIIEEDNRKGIVFQRIKGKTLLGCSMEKPWRLWSYGKLMAEFHYKIHGYSEDSLPSQKQRLAGKIRKSSALLGAREKRILDYLESLPDGNSICHGDFNFVNIIISDNGPVAIDWSSGYRGNPLGDVAKTCLELRAFPSIPEMAFLFKAMPDIPRTLVYWSYLGEYMRLAGVDFSDIDAWMLPVAAASLKEGLWNQKHLMGIIDKHLQKYGV